mmetsp:Transcript_16462/g.45603  ORF Transcript_16462/g.45603 Transcript_16462/m.45603 type:complete len:307 (-) Transcript_16462:379-1299(-)
MRKASLSPSAVLLLAVFSWGWLGLRVRTRGRPLAFAATPSRMVLPGTMPKEEQPVLTPLDAGSRVLVVGATRGIGLEFVRQLLDKGCEVVATHRAKKASPALKELDVAGRLSLLRMDVTDEKSIVAAAKSLSSQKRTLTHIIHSAGIYGAVGTFDGRERQGRAAAPPVTKETMMQVFEVNAVGPLLVAQQFAPLLVAASEGQLPILAILTSKVASVDDNASGGAYAYRASKSACNIIAKSLYIDLRSEDRGTVVLLHPGYVKTDMTEGRGLVDAETSVAGMLKAIEATGPKTAFRWVDYKAYCIPW